MGIGAAGTDSNDSATDVVDSAQTLVLALRRFKMDPTESVNRVRFSPFPSPYASTNPPPIHQAFAEKIAEYRLESDSYAASSPTLSHSPQASYGGGLSPEIVRAIDSLWHDPIIPSVLDRSSEFYLMDSAP